MILRIMALRLMTQHNEIQHKELNLLRTAEHLTVILGVVCRYGECRHVERRKFCEPKQVAGYLTSALTLPIHQ